MPLKINPATGLLDLVNTGGGGGGAVDSVTGTANRIVITGTASDPIINIDTGYVGQTSITTLGTIATGVWNGTPVGPTFGGTGLNSYASGDIIYASATNVLSNLNKATNTQVLTLAGGFPTWATPTVGTVTSVSGTLNRVSSTGGATPVIDIDTGYVGQASITTIGTIAVGTWNGTAIGAQFGGTGQTVYAVGDILYADTTTTLTQLVKADDDDVLTLALGVPTWAPASGGGGLTWNTITGTSQSAAVNQGYRCDNVAQTTVTLPVTSAVNDIIRVAGTGAGGWIIDYTTNQLIHFLGVDTTTTTGNLTSTNRYDSVELICSVANLEWVVLDSSGNITPN